jgi:hypothetical protein
MTEAIRNGLPIELLDLEPEATPVAFDNYRSVGDPEVLIFVPNRAVPPFRFKAGGWELLQSSIDLGPVMKTRIAEKGFFMCRLIEGVSGWTEMIDLVVRPKESGA